MLITFKSHASQDLIMMNDLAVTLLGIIGKTVGQRGVITKEELPRAIHRLEAAMSDAKRVARTTEAEAAEKRDDYDDHEEPLHLGQRAYPLLDMLRASQREGCDVMWGV